MPQVISIELYQLLEEKLGKEEAKKVASAIEIGLEVIEKKAEAVALQKKLEIKDELTNELATKVDIARLEGDIKTVRQEMETLRQEMKNELLKLDRKFTIMFIVLFFTIIFLNQNALEFFARVVGLIK